MAIKHYLPLPILQNKLREEPEIGTAFSGGIAGEFFHPFFFIYLQFRTLCSSCFTILDTGAITATVVCPLDVLKTRLQVQTSSTRAQYYGISGKQRLLPCWQQSGKAYESVLKGDSDDDH
jgi:hypothetical protein